MMGRLLSKFIFTDANNIATEMDDVLNVSISLGSEIKNNNMEIEVANQVVNVIKSSPVVVLQRRWCSPVTGELLFQVANNSFGATIPEETIDVYLHYTTTNPNQNITSPEFLLFTAYIDDLSGDIDRKGGKIKLKGRDRSIVLMSKLSIPQAYDVEDNFNSPKLLQKVVRDASGQPDDAKPSYTDAGVLATPGKYLIDARLFTEGIKTTSTSDSVASRKLIDSTATFITDGVNKGDWVRNNDTYQSAYVSSVVSETELILTKNIFLADSSYSISDGFIQDWRPDGTLFPSFAYNIIDQPVVNIISEISQTDRTNTQAEENSSTQKVKRGCRYFIDTRNRAHWYIPSNTPEIYLDTTTSEPVAPDPIGYQIYVVELVKKVEGNVNFIIYKAGEDMDNVMIKDYAYAPFSGSPIQKDAFRDYSGIARLMKSQEAKAQNISKLLSDEYGYPATYNPLPNGATYPSWDTIRNRVPTTDEEYNESFVENAIKYGDSLALREFQELSNPRWSGTITVQGNEFQVGDLINLSVPQRGIYNLKVRVDTVRHTVNHKQGWRTQLSVQEDEKELN